MIQKWYNCMYCRTVVKKETMPDDSGCTVKAQHRWTELGEVGNIFYECKKCGIIIKTLDEPSEEGCSETTAHLWMKLNNGKLKHNYGEEAENPVKE
jgi:hypothetical protein